MSSRRIVHSGLDTRECTILRDDVQMCAECLIPNAQSFRSELGELAESSATPEYTYMLASSAGACNDAMTRSVEMYVAVIVSFYT